MNGQRVRQGLFFSLTVGVVALCASCGTQPAAPGGGAAATPVEVEKCRISITATGPSASCDISKAKKEIAVFINADDQRQNLYVCADDPTHSAFDAYAWYVPYGDRRKSRAIRDDFSTAPSSSEEFDYDVSTTPCGSSAPAAANTPLKAKALTNPRIIIKASN